MYLHTYGAGNRRNLYHGVTNGKIILKENGLTTEYIIRDGLIAEIIEYRNNIKNHIVYGKYRKKYINGKKIYEELYRANSNCARIIKGEWKKCEGYLGKYEVKIKQKCYGGSFRKETVKYKGTNKIAYNVYSGKKYLTVFYPSGIPWMILQGNQDNKIRFAYKGSILCEINLDKKPKDIYENLTLEYNNLFSGNNYTILVNDEKGKTKIKGKVENRQKVGEWLENYKNVYYIMGVVVTKKMFFAKPDELDPKEVLNLENVQLRTALLNRIGLEKVLQKIGGKVIDKNGDNELIQILLKQGKNNFGNEGDNILALLKVRCPSTGVYYTLRVPPDAVNCEQARQWTFGVNNPTPTKDKNWVELVDET